MPIFDAADTLVQSNETDSVRARTAMETSWFTAPEPTVSAPPVVPAPRRKPYRSGIPEPAPTHAEAETPCHIASLPSPTPPLTR
jgi:hypothetical protein